jgi:hypothetical protein
LGLGETMANDEREQEREFLAGLKARTGRDLAEWMAAIAAQGFEDKNEIIDWLRNEGLPFARASWLERIHRNGGKPIHAGSLAGAVPPGLTPGHGGQNVAPPTPASAPLPMQAAPSPSQPHAQATPPEPGVRPARSDPRPVKQAQKLPPLVEASSSPAALEKLVAAAKGYRPLYHHLEAQVRQAIPGIVIAPRDRYVSVGAPREFAAITLHPTELRLGLDLGDRPFDAQVQKAKLRGPGPGITHMVVLTDARQVNDGLLALVMSAHARVNASA